MLRITIVEGLLRLSYLLKDYRSPLLAGSASFFTALIVYLIYEQTLNPFRSPTSGTNLAIAAIFFVCWFVSTNAMSHFFATCLRRRRSQEKTIGIFTLENDEECKRYPPALRNANYTPAHWKQRFDAQGFQTTLIVNCDELSNFTVVVNPFGELYLEENLANLDSFRKIKDYIKRGGVFVNTGGLAFFYALNPKPPGIETLTGPPISTYEIKETTLIPIGWPDQSSIVDSFLFREFGVRTTTNEPMIHYETIVDPNFPSLSTPTFEVEPFRSTLRTEHSDTRVIPILRYRYVYKIPGIRAQTLRETFPLAAIEYGAGFLLLVGVVLKKEDALDYVIKTIQVLLHELQKTGTLE